MIKSSHLTKTREDCQWTGNHQQLEQHDAATYTTRRKVLFSEENRTNETEHDTSSQPGSWWFWTWLCTSSHSWRWRWRAARRQRKVLVALFFWSLEMKFAVELALFIIIFKIVNLIFANRPHFGTCITCSWSHSHLTEIYWSAIAPSKSDYD